MDIKNTTDEYVHVTANIFYTETNIPGPGLNLDEFHTEFAIGCKCETLCDSSQCSCNFGTPNYENNRLIENKTGPIIECNLNCKCRENCGNRLVQKGPLNCLRVVESPGRGFGLTTTAAIKKGQFICEYAGEVIGIDEARKRFEENRKEGANYVIVVNEHIGEKKITTCIDPKYFGNIGRFCNHSCEPNTHLVPVRVEKMSPRICLFARRDLKPDEEITFHYAEGVENSVHCLSETPCLCNSSSCLRYLPHHSV